MGSSRLSLTYLALLLEIEDSMSDDGVSFDSGASQQFEVLASPTSSLHFDSDMDEDIFQDDPNLSPSNDYHEPSDFEWDHDIDDPPSPVIRLQSQPSQPNASVTSTPLETLAPQSPTRSVSSAASTHQVSSPPLPEISLQSRLTDPNEPAASIPHERLDPQSPTRSESISSARSGPAVPEQSISGPGTARDRSPDGPPAKILKTEDRKDVADREENEDDGETCPICLERWSNSADHRLVSLKCGHLFGCKCIKQWLHSQRPPDRKCPTCKAKATVRDIRYLYARRLIAVDSSEIDSLKEQLEQTKSQKCKVELELQQCQIQARSTLAELTRLRSVLKDREATTNQRKPVSFHYSLERTVEVTQEPTCRVLAYNSRKYELWASQKSSLTLFPGYGVRKIDCVNLTAGQFVHLHSKAIRDLQYSSTNDLFLSVSQDKTAKLMCGQNSQVTSVIKTDHPLWSCSWSILNPNEFLIGCDGGVTLQYDIRSPNEPLGRFAATGVDVTPVVSLASTLDGFLACHLNSCWFYVRAGSEHRPYMIPIEGSFLSVSYDDVSRQMLVSCRPTTAYQRARHIVADLDFSNGEVSCNLVQTFMGSSVQHLMSRSRQMRVGEESWFAAHNESAAAVCLYNVNTFKLMQSLMTQDRIVDICPIEKLDGNNFLATLSTSKVRIYKAAAV